MKCYKQFGKILYCGENKIKNKHMCGPRNSFMQYLTFFPVDFMMKYGLTVHKQLISMSFFIRH